MHCTPDVLLPGPNLTRTHTFKLWLLQSKLQKVCESVVRSSDSPVIPAPLHPMPKVEQAKVRIKTNPILISVLIVNCTFLRFLFWLIHDCWGFSDTCTNLFFSDAFCMHLLDFLVFPLGGINACWGNYGLQVMACHMHCYCPQIQASS